MCPGKYAISNSIRWEITSEDNVGVKNFWFGGQTVSLYCEKPDEKGNRKVMVQSDGDFDLFVNYVDSEVSRTVIKGAPVEFMLSGKKVSTN